MSDERPPTGTPDPIEAALRQVRKSQPPIDPAALRELPRKVTRELRRQTGSLNKPATPRPEPTPGSAAAPASAAVQNLADESLRPISQPALPAAPPAAPSLRLRPYTPRSYGPEVTDRIDQRRPVVLWLAIAAAVAIAAAWLLLR